MNAGEKWCRKVISSGSLSLALSPLSYDNREKAWLHLYWTVGAKSKSLPEDDASSYEYVLSSPTPHTTILLLLLQHFSSLTSYPYVSIRISDLHWKATKATKIAPLGVTKINTKVG